MSGDWAEHPGTPEDNQKLQGLLKKVERLRRTQTIDQLDDGIPFEDVDTVCSIFGTTLHTAAYLVLSAMASYVRERGEKASLSKEQTTERIARLFVPIMDRGIRATVDTDALPALFLNVAITQVDPLVGTFLFLRDGMVEWLDELPDLFPTPLIRRQVTILLSIASSQAACRPVISANFIPWLELQSRQSENPQVRTTAAVVLTKLSRAEAESEEAGEGLGDTAVISSEEKIDRARRKHEKEAELTKLMKTMIITETAGEENLSPALDAVEGLAYLSNEIALKDTLSNDSEFLKKLFGLLPSVRKPIKPISQLIDDAPSATISTALQYGLAVIISNLVAFAPRLTEEQSQMHKLRRMASPGTVKPGARLQEAQPEVDERESDANVITRGKRLIQAGALPALATLARAESVATRRAVGRAYLCLIEPKENRGQIMQSGGAKALTGLIKNALSASASTPAATTLQKKADQLPAEDLIPIQALAKLSITTEPKLLFGPSETTIYDIIGPFIILLLHPNSTLLQKFESMMALTNLASVGPGVSNRIATVELANKIDILLLDDNVLVRRAATELVCNLVSTETMLPRYGENVSQNEKAVSSSKPIKPSKTVTSRLHLLLALSDVEDMGTRLAASGALATLLSASPSACHALLSIEKGPVGVLAILGDVIDPSRVKDDGDDEKSNFTPPAPPGEVLQLAHRGVVCIWGILHHCTQLGLEQSVIAAAKQEALAAALVALIKPLMTSTAQGPRQIVLSGAQSLKWLSDRGLDVVA